MQKVVSLSLLSPSLCLYDLDDCVSMELRISFQSAIKSKTSLP